MTLPPHAQDAAAGGEEGCPSVRVLCRLYRVFCHSYRVFCHSYRVFCHSYRVSCRSYRVLCRSYRVFCRSYRVLCRSYRFVSLQRTVSAWATVRKFGGHLRGGVCVGRGGEKEGGRERDLHYRNR